MHETARAFVEAVERDEPRSVAVGGLVNSTSPGKAFQCPNTLEPTGQGTCEQSKLPGVWCCGGAVTTCKRDTTVDQPECGHPGPSGPRPPKGYTCDDDKEPMDPKCVQGDLPIHWCCPK